MLTHEQIEAVPLLDNETLELWNQRQTVRGWTGMTMDEVMILSENEFNLHLHRAIAFQKTMQDLQMRAQHAQQEAAHNRMVLAQVNANGGATRPGLQIVKH